MNKVISIILNTIGTILLILVILICVPLTIPRLFGYEVYNVISGSMEPAIPTASLIYVAETSPVDLKEGEIIAFYGTRNQGSIITHRVYENRKVEGELITKGDANDKPDVNPVKYSEVIGSVRYHIPFLGFVAQIVSSFAGKIFMIGCILMKFILSALSSKLMEKSEVV